MQENHETVTCLVASQYEVMQRALGERPEIQ